jgi:uncharacterized protein (TIGR03435 family)
MRRLFRWTVLAVVLLAAGVAAQGQNPAGSLAGQWQGTLAVGPGLRLVVVLTTNAAAGGYSATFYSIDQTPVGLAATTIVQGGTVRIGVAPAGVTFEGKLSPDGNTIAGNFVQGPNSTPLTLVRATKETAYAIPAPPRAMAADAPTTFEVATIKPSNPDFQGKLFTVKGREVLTLGTTLSDLITFAYNVHTRQVTGGPPWMESDKYDVTGRPLAEGTPNDRQLREMIRTLLEDRFKLAIRRDKRDMQAYAITVGNTPPKLARNETNPNGLPSLLFKGLGMLPVVNATMSDFARVMQTAVLDRPVVDRTGLQGRFDFTLNWTPDESQFRSMGVRVPPPPQDGSGPPGLFTAIQEQLGLRLESVTAPVEIIVIDRVERPSDN